MKGVVAALLLAGCATVRLVETNSLGNFSRVAIPGFTNGDQEGQPMRDGCVAAAASLGKTVVELRDNPDLVVTLNLAYSVVERGAVSAVIASLVDPFQGTIRRAAEIDSPGSTMDARAAGNRVCRVLFTGENK